MGNVVMMRVYMAADPAMGNTLDFAGMNAAYAKYFGTAAQPNKPAPDIPGRSAGGDGRAGRNRSAGGSREVSRGRLPAERAETAEFLNIETTAITEPQ
jgi:hypothetical protein